jgi:Rha family phage regulatory protein
MKKDAAFASNKNESLVVAEGKFIFCDSRMVSEKFEVQHAKVVRTIELVISKFDEFKSDFKSPLNDDFDARFMKYEDEYRGKKFTAYRMNKTAFSMVAMRFETRAAFIWQSKFVVAFAKMERTIDQIANQKANAEWLEQRATGKIVRKLETDTLKKFVEYATNQGSTHANHYYSNISTMQNKALFFIDQKFKNIRELLDIHQLATLQIADRIVIRALESGMNEILNYKEIYQIAKQNIETFAIIHGKSPVPAQQIGYVSQRQIAMA